MSQPVNNDLPEIPEPGIDLEFMISIISGMYAPALSAGEADEIIGSLDLLETLRETEPGLGPKDLYDIMLGMSFKPLPIDGHVYWPVMST